MTDDKTFEVEITKIKGKLGLEIQEGTKGESNGIYVKSLGGAAANTGKIAIGDQILAIRAQQGRQGSKVYRLDDCTHEQAAEAMTKCGDNLSLLISRGSRVQGIHGNVVIKGF